VKALLLALLLSLFSMVARAEDVIIVDLNSATVEQLQKLPGIGPKKAEAIIAARNRRPFTRVTQLLEVRGIGKRTLDRLKPFVTIDGSAIPAVTVASSGAAGPR
jgi:competence ComEA-like helix-hairpin-helix protein